MTEHGKPSLPVINMTVESGFPVAIDAAAERASETHSFLRTAWYIGTAGDMASPAGASTLVALRPDGTPLAAIPTLPVGPAFLGARRVPGCYWPFRSFPLTDDIGEDEIDALIAHPVMRRWMTPLLRIGPFYDDDRAVTNLLEGAERAGWTILRRKLGTSFRIDLAAQRAEGPWPRKSSLRRLRTYEKQLAALGPVHIRHVANDGWTADVLDDLAVIEAQSWVGQDTDQSGTKFLTPEKRAGWLRATADPVLARMLTATLLYIGERPIAFTFDMLCGSIQYGIAGSYDKEYAAHSPGKLVAYRQYEVALERGIQIVDLGAGDSGYKQAQGAIAGPDILDCLIVRNRMLASLLRRKWEQGAADHG